MFVKTALKAKDVLCVSFDQNVLTPCHDKCLAKYKFSVNSKVRRALFTTPRTAKYKSLDTTSVVAKTRNSWAHSALETINLQKSQAMVIMYMAMSLSVMYIMLKVLDTTSFL
ncbi:hypothetical protein Tco_0664948 [Tanacetum coccineum]